MLISICDRHPDEMRQASSRSFEIDGQLLEIDLCSDCETRLLDVLSPFLTAARALPKKGSGPVTRAVTNGRSSAPVVAPSPHAPASAELDADQRAAIRKWATERGVYVYGRGRISQQIVNDYFEMVDA